MLLASAGIAAAADLSTIGTPRQLLPVADREQAIRREPVAAVLIGEGRKLAIAQAESCSLSELDLPSGTVTAEWQLPGQPSHLVTNPAGDRIWVTLRDRGVLLELAPAPVGGWTVLGERDVGRDPIRVALSPSADILAVTGCWSHQVTLIDALNVSAVPRAIRIGFPPRELLWHPEGGRLLVGDAFGGELAVIDATTANLVARGRLDEALNLRSLRWVGGEAEVACVHQLLHATGRTTTDDIHGGRLVENVISQWTFPTAASVVVEDGGESIGESPVWPATHIRLGSADAGAGDPSDTVSLGDDRWLTALAGRAEVVLHDSAGQEFWRLPVGIEPVQLVPLPEPGQLAVICRLSHSVAIVDTQSGTIGREISLGQSPPDTPAVRGERLFRDARLSHAGWLSCQSCHPDGHSSDGLADTFSDGTYGTPKRVLSLLGTRDNNPWGWNGQFRELHDQVRQSVTSSLQGQPLPAPAVNDLVTYLHTLAPPPPVFDGATSDRLRAADVAAGAALFQSLGCARCHVPPLTYTTDGVVDVGLSDEAGLRKYNPPSLRGLSQRRRFFHDGRAKSIREVLTIESHQLERELSPEDLSRLEAFLLSL